MNKRVTKRRGKPGKSPEPLARGDGGCPLTAKKRNNPKGDEEHLGKVGRVCVLM